MPPIPLGFPLPTPPELSPGAVGGSRELPPSSPLGSHRLRLALQQPDPKGHQWDPKAPNGTLKPSAGPQKPPAGPYSCQLNPKSHQLDPKCPQWDPTAISWTLGAPNRILQPPMEP